MSNHFVKLIFLLFIHSSLIAQTYEVGVLFGSTDFTGDVGSTSYALPTDYLDADKMSYGLLFKWNRSDRHSFRFSILRANTYADDTQSDINRRVERGFTFNQDITELSAAIEYTFWEWDPHKLSTQIAPYLATGPTYFTAKHHYVSNNQLVEDSRYGSFAIPMIIGIKAKWNTHWVVGFEVGARYTFTDNLDGSNPSEIGDEINFISFGNSNTNDWYMFAGFTLTYSFGRKPCYCNF